MQEFYCLTSLPCPPKIYSSHSGVAEDRPSFSVMQQCLVSGNEVGDLQHCTILQSLETCLSVLDSGVLHSPEQAQAPALLPVVFGYVVCQPVHFGFPALSQGFIKLQSEVLQCLLISFPKGQGVLQARGTNQCTTEQFTAQPVRCLFISNYSIERRNGVATNCF